MKRFHLDCEEAAGRDFDDGLISREAYQERLRQIQRDLRAAFEEEQDDALRHVRDEWGW